MDPVTLLKEDHDKVRDLFQRFVQAAPDSVDTKWEICQDVIRELTVHSALEQEIFYPAFQEAGGEEARNVVSQSLRDHEEITALMDEIDETGFDDPECEDKFQTLMEKVEEHASDEESDMFPKAYQALWDKFDTLFQQMSQRKQQLAQTVHTGRRAESAAGA